MKAYFKSNQGPNRRQVERKQFLKAKVPDVYYKKLHIDCYQICQKCKDHFKTSGITGAN